MAPEGADAEHESARVSHEGGGHEQDARAQRGGAAPTAAGPRGVVEGHEQVAKTARKVFPAAEKASDEPTADLLTQRLQLHEKTAWMLRSLLE